MNDLTALVKGKLYRVHFRYSAHAKTQLYKEIRSSSPMGYVGEFATVIFLEQGKWFHIRVIYGDLVGWFNTSYCKLDEVKNEGTG